MKTWLVRFGNALWCVSLHSGLAESRWASGKSPKIGLLSSPCQWQNCNHSMCEHFHGMVHKGTRLSVVLLLLLHIYYQLSHWHQSYCSCQWSSCHSESKQVAMRGRKLETGACPRNVFRHQVLDTMTLAHLAISERFATGSMFWVFSNIASGMEWLI